MNSSTRSYLHVSYDLRPAKQVERRMMIDAFHRLASAGFAIADYRYVGMGSIYFVDFILFHKLLGINKLLSVEKDCEIKKRVEFNKPFKEIETKVGDPIGNVIPTLSADEKHILWLDYDDLIRGDQLSDVAQAASSLSPGSILIMTVDSEAPAGSGPAEWRTYFEEEAGQYLGRKKNASYFAKPKLPMLNAHIIDQAIKGGIAGRAGVSFHPIFNFLYKDGHQMLTVGGMLTTPPETRMLRASSLSETPYYRNTLSTPPYEIKVPKLTRKERLHLDTEMPCPDNWLPREFEIAAEDVKAYREVYRFFPAYAELLL